MYTHSQQQIKTGLPFTEAKKVIIMLHGRGASAEDMIALAGHLDLAEAAILAPRATNNSWYPYSFMVPEQQNQPALNSALMMIDNLVKDVLTQGIPLNKIYFAGFSQGACLSLEYAARHAARYGGVIAFTGGLIGKDLDLRHYGGDFGNMPVLITTGDSDPHVPLSRVEETVDVLKKINAGVILKVYKNRAHTVQREEIELANELILNH